MAINYYDSFRRKLEEIFMMDHAELDFGIYRIMNQKRQDIQNFLQNQLLPQVRTALQSNDSDVIKARQRMQEIEAQLGSDIDSLPKSIPMVVEYDQLKAQVGNAGDTDTLQGEVFSHLVNFFSRYYDGGDFLSKRRYKADTYAIPYNGEEVKLHWANSDQYYIKTSEYFRNYTFALPTSRRKVHFVLKDASTEQNNNRLSNNMERRFAILQPENGEPIVETTNDGELNIYFTYELMPKTNKQKDLNAVALETILRLVPSEFDELKSLAPTASNSQRTLLEKHITDYTAKNSFDYFIHKDLGGFLRRELDFYIKNEVLHIDDLDERHMTSQLAVVRAIKLVGEKIITMLAQLENFQKRLWLKKKFVVGCDYCITLDRVPETLYPEIASNDAQRAEWVRLFAINEIQSEVLHPHGYSEPLSIDFLKENPFLVLDTAFFPAEFKHRLLAHIDKIDEQTNGLLVKSDNKHALELLIPKYKERISGVYIDPPYNTGSDGFLYKDNYLHSSWLSMMNDRLLSAKILMDELCPISISINENELFNLKYLMDVTFNEHYYTTLAVKVRHEDRILKGDKDFHEVYEDVLMYAKSSKFKPLKRKKDNSSIEDYRFIIETDSADETLSLGGKQVEAFAPGHYRIIRTEPSADNLKPISIRGSIREGNSSGRFYVSCLEVLPEAYAGYLFKVPNMGDDRFGFRYFWIPSKESGRRNGDYYQGKPLNGKDFIFIPYPNYIDLELAFNDATNEGGVPYRNGKKPLDFMKHILSLQKIEEKQDAIILDFFAGSATTGHSVIEFNKKDGGNRKYLLVQIGGIFDYVSKPRIQNAIYSSEWSNGKPVNRDGVSQCFKYIRLEQYEDTLNNLQLRQQGTLPSGEFGESYMLQYMLDVETRDSLLNLELFENPFAVTLKITRDNELVDTPVDMVETFNYLIGLNVETMSWHQDGNICAVTGKTHRRDERTLVIWRNCKEIDNESLNAFFKRMDFRTHDTEFDVIYVNGDNTLPNLRLNDENWKVVLIEEEFNKRMFEDN